MQIFIATYQHKHGEDVRAFSSEAEAETWRQKLAAEYWTDIMRGEIPADAGEAADDYFHRSGEIGDEWFTVTETELALPDAPG